MKWLDKLLFKMLMYPEVASADLLVYYLEQLNKTGIHDDDEDRFDDQRYFIEAYDTYRLVTILTPNFWNEGSICYQAANRYAELPTPFPPLIMTTNKIIDGRQRMLAAQLRNEPHLKVYMPITSCR